VTVGPIVRGDIVEVDLKGAEGNEKRNDSRSGSRPCIIVQNDVGNAVSPLTQVVPLTDDRQYKGFPVQVLLTAAELQMPGAKDSSAECGHVRTIDRSRILKVRGKVDPAAMKRVDQALRVSLSL